MAEEVGRELEVYNYNNNNDNTLIDDDDLEEEGAPKNPAIGDTFQTNIPARLDRLKWSKWHWRVCLALGISWVLDGMEITTMGIIGDTLQNDRTLGFSTRQVGLVGTIYILGAVTGAMIFGILSDKYGRRKLFLITPAIYLLATFATAFSWNFPTFAVCSFFTGVGIGGEYSAMNSAINELIPARVRGWVDLAINGSYWLGAALGAALSVIFLDENLFPINIGWRIPFAIGAILGIIIIFTRMYLPESPRWLMTHGRIAEAEDIVYSIEASINNSEQNGDAVQEEYNDKFITLKVQGNIRLSFVFREVFTKYIRRAILGLVLMISQAFFYNAIFFTYALILTHFYDVAPSDTGLYLIPFAIGNFLGAVTIGRLFDTIGRKPMIFITYTISAILLVCAGLAFAFDLLTALTQTICWSVIFFFSSAGAAAAYLTISEVFPLEIRAISIAIFYSLGTAGGGLIGPVLFGELVSTQDRWRLFGGYALGSTLMFLAGCTELVLGVAAEGKSLEDIAAPLSGEDSLNAQSVSTTTTADDDPHLVLIDEDSD